MSKHEKTYFDIDLCMSKILMTNKKKMLPIKADQNFRKYYLDRNLLGKTFSLALIGNIFCKSNLNIFDIDECMSIGYGFESWWSMSWH